MQQMNPAACASIATPTSTTEATEKQLYDVRDGKKYWVAKLKDGNCWMTQNLALDLNGKTLTVNDSDVTANWDGAKYVAGGLWNDTDSNVIKWYHSDVGTEHSSYGNYYSWCAATAGCRTKEGNDPVANEDAASSICPKGWRLPSNSSNIAPTFAGLGLNTSNITKSPYYFVYGGDVSSGKLNRAGSNGYYWSSTANSGTNAYFLYFLSSNVNPSHNSNRYNGLSVRCVAK